MLIISLYISLQILIFFMRYKNRPNGFMHFMKYVLVPLTIAGGWTMYFIGYCRCEPEQIMTNGLLAVFSTARLFILGNDLIEIHPCVETDHLFMLWFSVFGASAAFISASILIHLFGKKLITWCKIRMDRSGETHIFFGVNMASLSLAKDLLKNKKSRLVIFVQKMDRNEDDSLYNEVEESGAFLISRESVMESLELEKEESILHTHKGGSDYIRSDDPSPRNLKKLGLISKVLNRTTHLYFLSGREEWNLGKSRSVLDEINSLSPGKPVTLHIRTTSPELEDVFHQSLPRLSPNVKINLINLSEIVSRQLICKFNPVDWIDKDIQKAAASKDFTVFVVGFGQTGSAVLKKLLEYGQFSGSEFNAVVVDKDLQTKKGRFEVCFPGLLSNYNIEFAETGPGRSAFYNLVKQHINKLDYLLLTMGNDYLNIQTATDIQQFLLKSTGKRIRILAQVKDNKNYDMLFETSKQVSVSIFGREKDIFTENIVVRGNLEKAARKIHDYYNSKKEDGSKRQSWSELSVIKQLSNISAANHIYTKLTLAGLTVDDVKQFATTEDFVNFLGHDRMENLAKEEHLRWNALHFANGWNTWELNEIPGNATSNKDEVRKLHACLVSWEDLTHVKERFKEDYYAYDYENVSNIFELIRDGIYG
ncbi:MAG: hypothetical protein NTX61_17465 [Bacteroidetes bacterium]|nr:hypothetical protein [Bacteroidota bacterium]